MTYILLKWEKYILVNTSLFTLVSIFVSLFN
ncbi:hypothetical protein FHS90_003072 [Rufibacter quisquiliarum]|uniref:Uncharacterized protein n=1 Tax=Rufibacter quisquiliarum TaxID=1549639 RepID=A0A839GU75_9BACT|nr:hypothetical protein [Rufibacter quisquiliarum]